MGPTHRREKERLALRARILDTARTLFAEKGYEAVTMRMVAEAIEYSPRTLYLHFQDKDDLIRQLCEEDFLAFHRDMGAQLVDTDPVERVFQIGMAYVRFAQSYPHHYRLMFMTDIKKACPDPETCPTQKTDPRTNAYLALVQAMEAALATGRCSPAFQDPHLAAQIFWASLHGVLALEFTHCEDPWIPWRPLESRIEALVSILKGAFLKDPQAP